MILQIPAFTTNEEFFSWLFDRAMGSEGRGVYSDDPADRGGETYSGIARKKRPDWKGWALIDAAKVRPDFPACLKADAEINDLVRADYYETLFNRVGLDKLPRLTATEYFDTALNQGSGAAATHLQRALNVLNRQAKDYADVLVDGDLGPATFAAVEGLVKARGDRGVRALWRYQNALQGARYVEIAERDPTQEVYELGWAERVFED